MRVQMHSSAYRDRNRKLKPGSAWPLRRQLPDLRCAKPTAYGARDRNRTGMPGLAAAGFKPAVYTNFTTLANAGESYWRTASCWKQPAFTGFVQFYRLCSDMLNCKEKCISNN